MNTRAVQGEAARRSDELVEANQWLLLGRLVIAVIALVMVLLSGGGFWRADKGQWAYWAYIGAFAYLVLDLLYLIVSPRVERSGNMENFIFLQIWGDVAVASTLLYFTGGLFSPFFFLQFVIVLASAMFLGPRAVALFFLVLAILVGGITVAQGAGAVPGGSPFFRYYRTTELLVGYMGRMAALGAVGWLTFILMHRLALAKILSAEILESTGEAILVLDGEGRVVYESAEFRALAGGRFLGCSLDDIPLFGDQAGIGDLVRTPDEGPKRTRLRHAASGEERPFLVYVHPLEGEPRKGVLVRFQDLSPTERLQEVERRAERYRVLAEAARNIAHEIRNPLSSLNVALQELVRGMELSPDRKELVAVIRSEVRRLDRILETFLDYSRSREPNMRLSAVRGIAEESAEIIRRHQGGDTVQVRVDGPHDLTCRVDPDLLRQALLNLGINAVQAGAERVVIRVRRLRSEERDERGGDGILVEVEDDGPGMEAELLARIFEPFYTTKTTGTGLGLSLVQKIVELHEGRLDVESRPGEGTIFRIFLPRGSEG